MSSVFVHPPVKTPNWRVPALLVAASTILLFSLFSGRSIAFNAVAAMAVSATVVLFLVPIEVGIYLYFAYLFFDAFIKINANHVVVLHVAVDLLVILLLARSAYDAATVGTQKFFRTPRIGFFFVFVGWVALQYLNPFGLGILPSIAGSKVYLTAPVLFLLVYHHVPAHRLRPLLGFLLALGILQGVLACTEYLYFQDWVTALNPYYANFTKGQFGGVLYRPFGTTTFPGGASVWIFMTAPLCGYFMSTGSMRWWQRLAIGSVFLAVAIPTLVFCQVRVAILITALCLLACAMRPGPGWTKRVFGTLFTGMIAGSLLWSAASDTWNSTAKVRGSLSVAQREMLARRLETLTDRETYVKSRQGALNESLELAEVEVNGIGLSRVGAASEPWADRIDGDPYFGRRWSFADNLFRALFTELGIFGMAAWILLVLVLVGDQVRAVFSRRIAGDVAAVWCCAIGATIVILSGFGSEGVLYNPVSSLVWTYLAIGFRQIAVPRRIERTA